MHSQDAYVSLSHGHLLLITEIQGYVDLPGNAVPMKVTNENWLYLIVVALSETDKTEIDETSIRT